MKLSMVAQYEQDHIITSYLMTMAAIVRDERLAPIRSSMKAIDAMVQRFDREVELPHTDDARACAVWGDYEFVVGTHTGGLVTTALIRCANGAAWIAIQFNPSRQVRPGVTALVATERQAVDMIGQTLDAIKNGVPLQQF